MGSISKELRIKVFSKYKERCAYCGELMQYSKFTVDHIDPKRRGEPLHLRGSDKIDNLNPCCTSCNSSKSTFSIEKWRNELTLKYDRLVRDSSQFRILERFNIVKRTKNDVVFYFEKHDSTY